jgi:pilus assembly protein CpaF
MSLLDLVIETQGDVSENLQNGSYANFECGVKSLLNVEEITRLQKTNITLAKNEVKSACVSVLSRSDFSELNDELRNEYLNKYLIYLFGYGPIDALIKDEQVTEIMINGPFSIFYEKRGVICEYNERFESEEQLSIFIDRMLSPVGRRVDELSPLVSARIENGYRINVAIKPVALGGPYVTIRKFSDSLMTLQDMQMSGSIDSDLNDFLVQAVRSKKNIAVSGGTGSGKTTLLNALSCCILPTERVITIEDSAELRFSEHNHVLRMEARPKNSEGTGEVTIKDLVINALRMRPDRIVVGECRGQEALDMLQAMNTGHDGSLTTLHANSCSEAIDRLTTMVRYGNDIPVEVIESYICSAIHLIVQTHRDLCGRRYVCEVASPIYNKEKRIGSVHAIYKRNSFEDKGVWFNKESAYAKNEVYDL